jgi:Uma2 family endonuclease
MIQKVQQTDPHPRQWTQAEFDQLRELGFFDNQNVALVEGEIVHCGSPRFAEGEPRSWSKREYYRLGEFGFFMGQKAELLDGTIMVTSPQNFPHATALDGAADLFRRLFGPAVWVRSQLPLDLGQVIEPEPDVSVVSGMRRDYAAHPTTAVLIVEVSESTLAHDRGWKASLYAAAGISDYWIVNLVDAQLEVRRQPIADGSKPHGHTFADMRVLTRGENITPLAFPNVVIPVADLLP